MNINDELIPCPFCGGINTIIHENKGIWLGTKYGPPISVEIRHWCEKTEGSLNRCLILAGKDKDAAINRWNTRK